MSTQDDKTIAWQGRIQERAAHATKTILDRLATMPKSGINQLTPVERKDISETIAKAIVDTMATLGTFVTAGAQDFQVCHLEGINIGKGGKVAMKLVPQATESGGVNLGLLAANADKQVVVAMINGLAYSQAREALSKAIHREQTDWVQRTQDADMSEAEQQQQPTETIDTGAAAPAEPATENNQPSELIAEQPGENDAQADAGQQEPTPSDGETGATDASADAGSGQDGSGGGAVPADSQSVPAEGTATDRDSPLARAGRRVRRRTGGDERPSTH